jgi:phosphomethylpyrimidine synthase
MRSTNETLEHLLQVHQAELAEREGLDGEALREAVRAGTMVLLANRAHETVKPMLVGQPASIKVNANIGTSPFLNDPDLEMSKLRACEAAGAHTVMDLSTGGDLDRMRTRILAATELPVGTVPLYSVAQTYMGRQRDPADMATRELFDEIEKQAEQGVDFMTLHCGVTRKGASLAKQGGRRLGIVSRGGSILARWMERNDRENPLLEHYDRLLDICLKHNVTISLGDGLRPGAGSDAGDPAQWAEVQTLGELAGQARERGVQVMIEGPGHVPLDQIQSQIQVMKRLCQGAPLYVLGPLTTDIAAGYDHIAGAIGGTLAGYYGADFLCYVTPAEHLTLPNENDVWQGVKASLVAAHSAEVALGRRRAVERNDQISRARADLDWEAIAEHALDPFIVRKRREQFAGREECAMCGEYCAVKLQR